VKGERDRTVQAVVPDAAVQELRTRFRGQLLQPGDEGFDVARQVWNGMIDRTPALIARCTGVTDVRRALDFARSQELLVAVRGGGHNVAGNAVCEGGVVIDLSPMKGIWVDSVRRTARAQAGLNWGDFDHETAGCGLATTGGMVSTTGIAGLTLGGGIGWLMRKHGLTCDNLRSVEVITADGSVLIAGAEENADLFWGVRGGGGNFGIVTSFEYQLHPVSQVLGGMVLYPRAKAAELLRFYRDYVAGVPDELTSLVGFVTAPPAPFLPAEVHGVAVVGILVCYAGPIDEGERVVKPLRNFGPPLVDLIHPMPYPVLQSFLDPTAPPGLQTYWKSHYLNDLSDAAIDMLANPSPVPSPLSQVHLHHLQGAVSRVGDDETAVSYRNAPFALNVVGMWSNPGENDRQIKWTREFAAAMEPFGDGVYVNFLGEEGQDRVRAAYGGEKYKRLVALKDRYDPTNLFRLNQNVRPSGM
jgi:FAD/FMN-containing dehydrogenase